jgi:hypothetical protein
MAKGLRAVSAAAILIGLGIADVSWGLGTEVAVPDAMGGGTVTAKLTSTLTMGFGIRTQAPSADLIPKGDLDRNVCAPPYQSCQGLFRNQIFPSQHLVASPGAASSDLEGGEINYPKGSIFQAPFKATEDLDLSWGRWGFFGRALYFYDFINNDFTETFPNRLTPENVDHVGRIGTVLPLPGLNAYIQKLAQEGVPIGNNTALIGRFYGPGGEVKLKRTNGEVLREQGTDLQYLDSYLYGTIPLWDERDLSLKLGRQKVNWGESGLIALNSLNVANPINANNIFRIGASPEEFFIPINMIDASFSPIDKGEIEAYYQLEWKNTEAPTPGSYFSTVDNGTNNVGNSANAGYGVYPLDPNCLQNRVDNPLAVLTASCLTVFRLPDSEPRTTGQYGLKFNYYSEWLNHGTDLGLYFQHYHSRLPYLSFFSTYPSCGRREGNQFQNDATNIATLIQDCPGLPLLTFGGNKPTSDGLPADSARFVLEYPEDIDVAGLSFNTTLGNYSLQGEIAYRPRNPMQIDVHDLVFAALGPTGAACGMHDVQCRETIPFGIGYAPDGSVMDYGANDYPVDKDGNVVTQDAFNVGIAGVPGTQRFFPNFVIPYRGGRVAENPPCYPAKGSDADTQFGFNTFDHPYYAYNRSSPCYIRGYERFSDFEYNLAATRIYGVTENHVGADQVVMVYELGAEYVPSLPAYDQLVLQGPGYTAWGPTAGADGSGADRSRMACSTITDCSYGPDGMRFNPHQQDHSGYPDSVSWGYRVIAALKYEQIVPGITLSPTLLFFHDVQGSSPQPVGNFMAGRKQLITNVEFRYHQSVSANLGYAWFWGGGEFNNLRDRDFAQVSLRYQF